MPTGDLLRQPIPLARSILWAPQGVPRPESVELPMFMGQAALRAIAEHLAAPAATGQGLLGFLLGDRCEDPETGVTYTIVDAALRLNQAVYGDKTRDVVTRLRDRLGKQLAVQKAQLIGWYHTHAPLPLELSSHDAETQAQHFSEPWQVALLLGTDPLEPGGALFRRSDDDEWVRTPVPFYELLDDESFRPGGKKRSFLNWKTYKPYSGTAPAGGSARSVTPRSMPKVPRIEVPETLPPPAPEPEPEPLPPLEPPPPPPPPPPRQSGARERRVSGGELVFLSAAEDHAREPVVEPPTPPPAPPPPLPSPIHAATLPPAPLRPPGQRNSVDGLVVDGALGQVDEAPLPRRSQPDLRAPDVRPATLTSSEWRIVRARRRRMRRWALIALVVLAVIGAAVYFAPVAWQGAVGLAGQVRPFIANLHMPKMPKLPALPTMPWQRKKGATTAAPPPAPAAAPRPVPAPAAAPTPGPAAPAVIPPPKTSWEARFDALSDSLALALNTFSNRYRLFAERRLDCPGLARAAIALEERLAAYDAARVVAGALDGPRAGRDRDLHASAGAASQRFTQTRCERP